MRQACWICSANSKASAAAPSTRAGGRFGIDHDGFVADNLNELTGPTSGIVTLPHHICWSASPTRNLDNASTVISMYQTVLHEASTVEDLNTWLDRRRHCDQCR